MLAERRYTLPFQFIYRNTVMFFMCSSAFLSLPLSHPTELSSVCPHQTQQRMGRCDVALLCLPAPAHARILQKGFARRGQCQPGSLSSSRSHQPLLFLFLSSPTPLHQIRTSNIHIRQLYREFELYGEKHTLIFFPFFFLAFIYKLLFL